MTKFSAVLFYLLATLAIAAPVRRQIKSGDLAPLKVTGLDPVDVALDLAFAEGDQLNGPGGVPELPPNFNLNQAVADVIANDEQQFAQLQQTNASVRRELKSGDLPPLKVTGLDPVDVALELGFAEGDRLNGPGGIPELPPNFNLEQAVADVIASDERQFAENNAAGSAKRSHLNRL